MGRRLGRRVRGWGPVPPARILLWTTSLGAVGLALAALGFRAPPLSVAVGYLAGYLGVILVGVLAPQFEMFGDVLWHGPRDVPWVALTFDDGPHPVTTPKILECLERRRVKATFFVLGHKVLQHPEVVARIVAGGHTLGVHGYEHDRLLSVRAPARVAANIARTQAALRAAGAGESRF